MSSIPALKNHYALSNSAVEKSVPSRTADCTYCDPARTQQYTTSLRAMQHQLNMSARHAVGAGQAVVDTVVNLAPTLPELVDVSPAGLTAPALGVLWQSSAHQPTAKLGLLPNSLEREYGQRARQLQSNVANLQSFLDQPKQFLANKASNNVAQLEATLSGLPDTVKAMTPEEKGYASLMLVGSLITRRPKKLPEIEIDPRYVPELSAFSARGTRNDSVMNELGQLNKSLSGPATNTSSGPILVAHHATQTPDRVFLSLHDAQGQRTPGYSELASIGLTRNSNEPTFVRKESRLAMNSGERQQTHKTGHWLDVFYAMPDDGPSQLAQHFKTTYGFQAPIVKTPHQATGTFPGINYSLVPIKDIAISAPPHVVKGNAHLADVMQSISESGFDVTRKVRVEFRSVDNKYHLRHGDGQFRVLALQELGYQYIPAWVVRY